MIPLTTTVGNGFSCAAEGCSAWAAGSASASSANPRSSGGGAAEGGAQLNSAPADPRLCFDDVADIERCTPLWSPEEEPAAPERPDWLCGPALAGAARDVPPEEAPVFPDPGMFRRDRDDPDLELSLSAWKEETVGFE